jgi:DNA-directed RNA polymerase subunit L
MARQLTKLDDVHGCLHFNISGIHTSVANALRRTLIGNIPLVVMKPQDCSILANTTKFTNEILKSRIASIPVYSKTIVDTPIQIKHKMVDRGTFSLTTEHFGCPALFPPSSFHLGGKLISSHILFLYLQHNEEVDITCTTSFGCGIESGTYNATGTCSYAMAVDEDAALQAYHDMEDRPSIEDYNHLHKKRHVRKDSFDFLLKSECVYSEIELLQLACNVLIAQLNHLKDHHLVSSPSENMMDHCVDVVITGSFSMFDTMFDRHGDYSIGKMLEHVLYSYDAVTYVCYTKDHPHALNGILRMATAQHVDHLVFEACGHCIQLLTHLRDAFALL